MIPSICKIALAAALLVGWSPAPELARASDDDNGPWLSWQAELHRDHPLAGKVWSTESASFIEPRALTQALAEETHVLIGETHDNPDHHRLQAWLISAISKERKPGLVAEMLNADQIEALNAYFTRDDANAGDLGAILNWEASGWPDWSIYQPIAEAAIAASLTAYAGDPGRDIVRRVSKEGLSTLGPARRMELGLDRDLSADLNGALDAELMESHCNLLPVEAMPSMAGVQRFKDAFMAEAMRKADAGEGAILIAGNGHVRLDRGVPSYLPVEGENAKVAAIMLIELDETAKTAQDLAVLDPDGQPAADYFWFTPRVKRPDPCDTLREYLKK